MYYSYVMGIDEKIFTLKESGFKIKKHRGDYKVSFPEDKTDVWEDFIVDNLQVGFWNEYLKDNSVVFIFKLQDAIRRYEVSNYDNQEVLELCEQLCNCKLPSIKEMLMSNKFYKKIIRR